VQISWWSVANDVRSVSLGIFGGKWVVDCLSGRCAWFSYLETRNSQMENEIPIHLSGFENITISLQQSLSYAYEDLCSNIRHIIIILLVTGEKDHSHLFVDSKRGIELQWAKKGCVVWPCSMFTEIWMWGEKTF
jgi:hypothetical protein